MASRRPYAGQVDAIIPILLIAGFLLFFVLIIAAASHKPLAPCPQAQRPAWMVPLPNQGAMTIRHVRGHDAAARYENELKTGGEPSEARPTRAFVMSPY